MTFKNPLEANDWDIVRFLELIASLQLGVWMVIALDAVGLHIPLLREVVVLVYLLFVPGIILLRVLGLHELNQIEGVLYAIGLSLATVMLTGLFINVVYPPFITARPLSLLPFMATMTAVVAVLCVACYWRDRDFARPTAFDTQALTSPLVLVLALLPFVSIFGAYAFNVSGTSVGTIITLLCVAVVIAVCGFTNWVPKRYYGFLILMVSIALLLHSALITNYLWGFDIRTEQDVAQFVAGNGVWGAAPSVTQDSMNLNSMLSIAMLTPLLSIATGMSVTWILKLVIPLLFALVPLGLYRLYEKQSTQRIALFAVFYFMVVFSFYTEMLAMARQAIAEFFLVALLLLIVDKEMDRAHRYALFGVFAFSLIVSHYALTYIFLFCFILAWLIIALASRFDVGALLRRTARSAENGTSVRTFRCSKPLRKSKGVNAVLVVGSVLAAFVWYRFANNPQPFDSLVSVINRSLAVIGIPPPLHPSGIPSNASQSSYALPSVGGAMDTTGLQTILVQQFPMHDITKYLLFIAVTISVIGIFFAYRGRQRLQLAGEYVAFSIASVVILFLCLFEPYFAASLNLSRFYHITQIVLSLFFVIGFMGIARAIRLPHNKARAQAGVSVPLKALACFTVLLFIFNAGLVYKAAGELTDSPTVFSLDKSVDLSKFNDQEITAAKWVGAYGSGSNIYADWFRYYAVYTSDRVHVQHLPFGGYWAILPPGSYIYLGTPNVQGGQFIMAFNDVTTVPSQLDTTHFTGGSNAIYSNGGAEVYSTNG